MTLDGISRLKGIETYIISNRPQRPFDFGWYFPLEGN